MASRKTPLTLSPIAAAETPIYQLASVFQRDLFFPDPAPLYALAGALVANLHQGHPVWLMLLGSPSCGKSLLLNSLLSINGIHDASEINGTPALLSGVKRRDIAGDSKGGLLNDIGTHGGLVIEEFTSVLSMSQEKLQTLLAALRSIYYGRWSRNIGTEGGRKITWEGKLALFGGCTNVLDRYTQVSADMGERWIYYRFPETTGWAESNKILSRITDPSKIKQELCSGMLDFLSNLELDWNQNPEFRKLKRWEIDRLISVSQFSARARSSVPRDPRTLEILDAAIPEAPMRLANTLGQLYLGLEVAGLDSNESWRTIRKTALDCVPFLRVQVISAIQAGYKTVADIADKARTSPGAARRGIEDLCLHGVVEARPGVQGYRLTSWTDQVWGDAGFSLGESGA